MHTAESKFLNFTIEYLGEIGPNFKKFSPVYQGCRYVQIMKKMVENLVTHYL